MKDPGSGGWDLSTHHIISPKAWATKGFDAACFSKVAQSKQLDVSSRKTVRVRGRRKID